MERAADSFLKSLFDRGTQSPSAENEKTPPPKQTRDFYQREEKRDLEVLHRLDEAVEEFDKNIERCSKTLSQLTIDINALKAQYDKFGNKQSEPAKQIAGRATNLLRERKGIETRIEMYNQKRLTINMQAENLRDIIAAAEMDKLMRESTFLMQTSVASMDISTVKGTALDARMASNDAKKISSYVFNPFDIAYDENNSSFFDEFSAIDLSEHNEESSSMLNIDDFLPSKQKATVAKVDDLF